MRLGAVRTPLRAHRPWVLGCRPVEVRREVRWEHLPAMQDAMHGMHQPKHPMPCRHGEASSMPAGDGCHVMPMGGLPLAAAVRASAGAWTAPPAVCRARACHVGSPACHPSRPAVVLWAHLQAHPCLLLRRRRSRCRKAGRWERLERPPRHRLSSTSRHRDQASAGQQEPSWTRHRASARTGQLCSSQALPVSESKPLNPSKAASRPDATSSGLALYWPSTTRARDSLALRPAKQGSSCQPVQHGAGQGRHLAHGDGDRDAEGSPQYGDPCRPRPP